MQRELREVDGVTVIIYDQVCATKKRRERKRGTQADADKRVRDQRAGLRRLRRLLRAEQLPRRAAARDRVRPQAQHQPGHLQQGLLLRQGLLPELRDGRGRPAEEAGRRRARAKAPAGSRCPMPTLPDAATLRRIVVAGIGGTGIVTIGQVLGMAAHLEGKGVITQDATGMAQMGGATWSHIQIAASPDALHATRVSMANGRPGDRLRHRRRRQQDDARDDVARRVPSSSLNTHATPTAAFVGNPDWQSPGRPVRGRADRRCVGDGAARPPSTPNSWPRNCSAQSVYTNMLMLGYRLAKGPRAACRTRRSCARSSSTACRWTEQGSLRMGPPCAHDLSRVPVRDGQRPGRSSSRASRRSTSSSASDADFLVGYQNGAYADRYRDLRRKVCAQSESVRRQHALTEAVARYLFKLMAYKDEYEVARLHTGAAFRQADRIHVRRRVPPGASPGAAAVRQEEPRRRAVKRAFGPWMRSAFGVLARLKGLRGTAFDPFGYTEERTQERTLILEYRALHRGTAARAVGAEPGPGTGDRQDPGGDPRLRPCQGAQRGRREDEVGAPDGPVARAGIAAAEQKVEGGGLDSSD